MLEMPLSIFAKTDDFPFFIQYGFHEKECALHGHADFSELVVVMDGSAVHTVECENYPIKKGDVFVVDKYTHHQYTQANNFKICNIMFKPDFFFNNLNFLRQNTGFQALFVLEPYYTQNHKFNSRLCLHPDDYSAVTLLISEIIREQTEKKESWQTLIYAKFIQLCTLLSRLYLSYDTGQNDNIFKLASAIAYIEKNFCSEISISGLAKLSGYSTRQLNRLFNSAFSKTPRVYINDLKLQKSRQLLKNTNMTMGEIALNCGFPDQNYFSRLFKKHIGMTPSQYRSNAM